MKGTLLFPIVLLLLSIISSCKGNEQKVRVLPIVGDFDIEYRLVDGKEVEDTIYPKVPDFKYLNHDSVWIDSKNYQGQIKIVDFFFSSCRTICPPMTEQMKRLNVMTQDIQDKLSFFSFSIDPTIDQPSILKTHRHNRGITAKNWNFLTGDEAETHQLAHDFFHVGAERNDLVDGGFYHTDTFVLVDREGYVRGLYQGTDTKAVNQMEIDIRKLLEYEYNNK